MEISPEYTHPYPVKIRQSPSGPYIKLPPKVRQLMKWKPGQELIITVDSTQQRLIITKKLKPR